MANKRPLATLYKMHRILIATGIFCSLMMAVWGVRQWRAGGEGSPLVVGVVGLVAAVALGLYLRHFNAKIARP